MSRKVVAGDRAPLSSSAYAARRACPSVPVAAGAAVAAAAKREPKLMREAAA